jgi:hypothetical protein
VLDLAKIYNFFFVLICGWSWQQQRQVGGGAMRVAVAVGHEGGGT